MKLLCDEDVGTGVPTALAAVGFAARPLVGLGLGGRPDVEWLAFAGQHEWVVFSYNKKMLLVPEEREVIVENKVGIVFLTTGLVPAKTLHLLLGKWRALELLDSTQPRPFARFLTPRGQIRHKYRHYPIIG